MAVVACDPEPGLRPYARQYYGFREVTDGPVLRREGPGVDVLVLFSFGTGWRIGDATDPKRAAERHESFAAGLHHHAVLTEHDGSSYGLQVSLTPPGAYALFGVPLHELGDRTVAVDDVLPDATRLAERLEALDDWDTRFALVDRVIASRLDPTRATPGVAWAWRRLSETHGRLSIESLARELGWSRKRLVHRFREEIGMAPKSLARLLRFERARALLEQSDRPALAQVAASCGYYDQAHLTHEVRRITGTTPAAYVAETIFQDGVPA